MKSWRLLALAGAFGLLPCTHAQSVPLTLEDVVKKTLTALGGVEKLSAINTLKSTGKLIVGGGPVEAPLVTYVKRPNSSRTELLFQGQKIIDAFDGTAGVKWSINPLAGIPTPQRANDEEASAAAGQPDLIGGALFRYKEKGSTAELSGKEDAEGSLAYKIKVTGKTGNFLTVYVNEATFLPIKTVTRFERMGQAVETETIVSNYKPVEGVLQPFSILIRVNHQAGMEMQFDRIEANLPLDDSLFAVPETIRRPEPPKTQ